MPHENIVNVPRSQVLTDNEAVTLRRIAFGESDVRLLRRADIDRLLELHLIVDGPGGMGLTRTGKEHFESLPRSALSSRPKRHYGP
jgi:hypothetical protein